MINDKISVIDERIKKLEEKNDINENIIAGLINSLFDIVDIYALVMNSYSYQIQSNAIHINILHSSLSPNKIKQSEIKKRVDSLKKNEEILNMYNRSITSQINSYIKNLESWYNSFSNFPIETNFKERINFILSSLNNKKDHKNIMKSLSDLILMILGVEGALKEEDIISKAKGYRGYLVISAIMRLYEENKIELDNDKWMLK